jgi:hypothetical protein
VEIGGAELTEVVQTIRRQSERKVREEIVSELKERLERLRGWAVEKEASGVLLGEDSWLAGLIDEAAHSLWVARGCPYRGSTSSHVDTLVLPGHRVVVESRWPGVRFGARCGCGGTISGWSPTIMGAKRLARRHAGLM